MIESKHFTFDGISSEDMGVYLVKTGNGLFEEFFYASRVIIETRIGNRNKPYFQRVEHLPLSFNLTIYISEWRQRDNLRQIAKWLMTDYYKPLFFESNPERIYYAMVEGSSNLIHNGRKDGFITLTFRCNSPFTYSPTHLIEGIQSDSDFVLYNEGDMTIKPKIRIKKTVNDGSVSITNVTTQESCVLTALKVDEEVYIDMENEHITSSLENLDVYRYDNHNGIWLSLVEGENIFAFFGDFELSIEYEMIYLA